MRIFTFKRTVQNIYLDTLKGLWRIHGEGIGGRGWGAGWVGWAGWAGWVGWVGWGNGKGGKAMEYTK